jgi:tagatose-6-phosphate ketose/aldose isomerase
MTPFNTFTTLPESKIPGSFHTVREIAQQPDVWMKVLALMEERADGIAAFLRDAGVADPAAGRAPVSLVLAGAGTSDFIGRSVAPSLRRRLGLEARAVATTDIVTHPDICGVPGQPLLVVHFARSGDSPESLASYRLLKKARPDSRHMVITCNEQGALRREAGGDPAALVIVLPPETNDRSLAMTSSFTGMALAALCLGWSARGPAGGSAPDAGRGLRDAVTAAAAAARRVIGDPADGVGAFGERAFDRACYLGSDALAGAMTEGALKMQEMTAGRVVTCSNSFLGVRHGPQVFINDKCIVVACLSSDPRVRPYEMDLLRELGAKGQGAGILAVSAREDPELAAVADRVVSLAPAGAGASTDAGIPDELRVLTDIVVCQILAVHASRRLGLSPDNPSPGGVITRVVQGVTIH